MILLWIQICPFYKSMIIAIWLRYLPWNYPGSSFCKHNREPSQSPVDSQQPTYKESDKAFSVNTLGAGSDLELPGGSLEIQQAQWNLKGPRPEQCSIYCSLLQHWWPNHFWNPSRTWPIGWGHLSPRSHLVWLQESLQLEKDQHHVPAKKDSENGIKLKKPRSKIHSGGPAVDPKKQWWARRGPGINNRIE